MGEGTVGTAVAGEVLRTSRSPRSLVNRVTPAAVLVLGVGYVVLCLLTLDNFHRGNGAVLRSWQVAPEPMAARNDVVELVNAGRRAFERWSTGRRICGVVPVLCDDRQPPPEPPPATSDLTEAAQAAFGQGSGDVSVVRWHDGAVQVTAVVARHATQEGAETALASARSLDAGDRAAWLAGDRLLVGVLVAGPDGAALPEVLADNVERVRSYVGGARAVWFELVALAPLLAVLVVWASMRTVVTIAAAISCAVFAVVAGAAIVAFLLVLPVLILVAVVKRRRNATRVLPPPSSAQATGPDLVVADLDVGLDRLHDQQRRALLVVIVLIGFAIAVLTTPLLPASIGWGSLALLAAPSWRRGRRVRRVLRGRGAAIVYGLGVLLLAYAMGFVSFSDSDGVSAVLVTAAAVFAAVAVAAEWRALTAGASATAQELSEDLDTRSTVYLAGVAVLTLASASLFFASSAERSTAAQLTSKGVAALGLFVALGVAGNVRAAREASRRDRERAGGRAPVLYLRSFGDDGLRVASPRLQRSGLERLSWRRRELFEDVVARSFSGIGPVVAIARPGTGQGDLGAARDSIVVDDWLDVVRAYMLDARLVVLSLGRSEGLGQELESLRQLELLHRLVVLIPPVPDREAEARLQLFARAMGDARVLEDASRRSNVRRGRPKRVVAVTGLGQTQRVMIARRRRAAAYRAAAASAL